MSEMTDLIERVEKASGPDRELDVLVGAEVNLFADNRYLCLRKTLEICGMAQTLEMAESHQNILRTELPRYTASIDAALTLLPHGYASAVGTMAFKNCNKKPWATYWTPQGVPHSVEAETPALAVTLAALKARAAISAATGANHDS
jgi:hypothetical protein